MTSLIGFENARCSMRWLIVVTVLVAGIAALLTAAAIAPGFGEGPVTVPGPNELPGGPVYVNHTVHSPVTAMYSKNISADTPFIIVDLYSGDPNDPVTLSIIAPDRTLGPFTDISDGRKDGRIYLKISRSTGLTPGVWKFRVQSEKDIAIFNWVPKIANSTKDENTTRDDSDIEIQRPPAGA